MGRCAHLSPGSLSYPLRPADLTPVPRHAAFFHPDDLGHAFEIYNAGIESGQDFTAEHRIRGADGSTRWFRTAGSACRADNGDILAFACNITDIDELVKVRRRPAPPRLEPTDRAHSDASPPPACRLGTMRSSSKSARKLSWQDLVRLRRSTCLCERGGP